jgi:hypothetical protein
MTTNFMDDSKLIDFLNIDGDCEELDMGQIDEEDKPFLLINKDTGQVFDIRNESALRRISSRVLSNREIVDLMPDQSK